MSVTAAAKQLDVVPSTAHRLLGALCDRGFAVQDRERHYRAGPELVPPSDDVIPLGVLRRAARPALEWLGDTLDETTQLMVRKGQNIEFVDGVESSATLRVAVRIGDQMPAYCSAGGKALLAELSDADVEHIYHRGLTPWPSARITEVAALTRHLDAIRRSGYGVNVGETEDGVCGVGACVHDSAGRAIAALTTAIPSPRFRKADVRRYADQVLAAARMVEQSLAAVD